MILVLTLPLVSAIPYWVKPGVYIEYAAMRYDPYIQYKISQGGTSPKLIRTAYITYIHNGTLYRIRVYDDVHVRFRVLEEKNGYLTVGGVRIEMRNVTLGVSVPQGKKSDSDMGGRWGGGYKD
ncbi:hypothetical protein [Thermococcus sp. JCM 11816]|uniref:hypothetical protein n=1 Tax=Thermococcus sp. (strain JCM 11816 / KS-1) TaxID=1295125 RepID=UPI003465BE7E